MECCEKLIAPSSIEIAVKRNVWNLLPLDIQIDIFRCLRAYDLHKNGINVSHEWRNTIEKHKGILPKFRQLTDYRQQQRLIDSNDECRQRQNDLSKDQERRSRRRNRIRRNLTWTYFLHIIISFIAILLAQPISAERIAAKVLLLLVSLLMFGTYHKIVRDDNWFEICGRTYKRIYSNHVIKYVWTAYLVARSLIFVGFAILVHLIDLQADTLFNTVLASLYLPEGAYLINWSINAGYKIFRYSSNTEMENGDIDLPTDNTYLPASIFAPGFWSS